MNGREAHVLHLIDTGGPGGAETVFAHLAAELPREFGAPIPVVSREGWLAEHLRSRGLQPRALDPHGSFNLGYLRALTDLIRRERVRLIVAHLYGSLIYGGVAGRLTGVPVLGALHGQTDVGGGRLAALKAAIVRHAVRHVVFVSYPLRTELNAALRIPLARTSVIPNGVDMQRFVPGRTGSLRAELGLPEGVALVGAVGNLRPAKGYDILLRAWKRVRDAGVKAHLVVAGEGSGGLRDRLFALREELGLAGSMTFLGLRSDVHDILASLDLFVSSSTTEGFSIVCIEAMASGVPVLATRSGGPESILEQGRSGELVAAGDDAALAEGLIALLRDPARRAGLAAAGRARAVSEYSVQKQIDAYAGIARGLIHGS